MKKYSIFFFFIMFLIGTDSFLISPLLPSLARDFHTATSLSGWMTASYMIGFALFTLLAGPLSDSRDRKQVMLMGLSIFALATFLCAFALNFPMMIAFRFLAGVAASFVTPQVWASVARVAQDPAERMKLMGIVMAGLAGAQVLGVPIGSVLAMQSWHIPFITVGIVTVILILVLVKFLPSLAPDPTAPKQSIHEIYRGVFKNHAALRFTLAFGLFFTGASAVFSFIGTWYETDFHLNVGLVGFALLFSGLAQFLGGLFGHKLTDKWGHKKSLAIGFVVWPILMLLLPFAQNVVWATVIMALSTSFLGMLIPVMVMNLQNTAPEARGTMSSLSNFAMYTGQAIGGAMAGLLFANLPGFFGVAGFALIFYLISAGVNAWAGFWKKKEV
ncbi:MAG: MFS transporter [Streptococcaceae bacterium]|jgi:predicted MFS family arabinose efflux permease|nr:MFS transporter [Streptococcaceae bacterium]